MAKPPNTAQRRHLAEVRKNPCLACQHWPTEAHHLRHDGYKGISKRHDRAIPLCARCHRDGPQAIHRIGHPAFAELHGLNLMVEAERLWAESELIAKYEGRRYG